jgi:hypothetical protein
MSTIEITPVPDLRVQVEENELVVELEDTQVEIVEIATGPQGPVGPEGPTGPVSTVPGPQGPTGPQGPSGESVERTVMIPQPDPSNIWIVQHNLGYYPAGIRVLDSADTEIEGDVEYLDANTIRLTFLIGAFSGKVYLS